jgi:lipoteichoic acid synthase
MRMYVQTDNLYDIVTIRGERSMSNEKHYAKHLHPNTKGSVLYIFFFPCALFFLEGVVKYNSFGVLFNRGLGYTLLFTVPAGLICSIFCSLWSRKVNRRCSIVLMCIITCWYMLQMVYFLIFQTFLTLYSLGGAVKLISYWREGIEGVKNAAGPLLLLCIPLFLLFVFNRHITPERRSGWRKTGSLALGAVVFQMLAVLTVTSATAGVMSPQVLYQESFIPDLSVSTFGVATTLRLDAKQLIFGAPGMDSDQSGQPRTSQPPEDTSKQPLYEPNQMNIDFEGLIAAQTNPTLKEMHQFFSGRTPTLKNEYTGRFKGKNLIFITAEGFSSYAVDPTLTPTLYKLANTGFVFRHYYNPLWWASTSDGEYVPCTSLVPKPGVWSLYRSSSNDMYFCLGNQFRRIGYSTRAYHNHAWDYYRRDVSHPNMGYDYKGVGNGLEVKQTWPESDLEMMQVTLPEYLGTVPFHIYYMTVSGHMNYTFMGNSMASKHKDEVQHLQMSENARAYKACQIELDLALEYLLQQLEEAGQLESTVICLSADHYPYGLDKTVIDEMAGHEVDKTFEIYQNTLILWSGDMKEPVIVDKLCDTLDLVPTLSNLFGLEYDSRLLMGQDIFSDSPGLVVLSNRSFISELGKYDAMADVFTPNEGSIVPENYVRDVAAEIRNMFNYSVKILENDYYAKLGLPREP